MSYENKFRPRCVQSWCVENKTSYYKKSVFKEISLFDRNSVTRNKFGLDVVSFLLIIFPHRQILKIQINKYKNKQNPVNSIRGKITLF